LSERGIDQCRRERGGGGRERRDVQPRTTSSPSSSFPPALYNDAVSREVELVPIPVEAKIEETAETGVPMVEEREERGWGKERERR
jgi:hypothetical protein